MLLQVRRMAEHLDNFNRQVKAQYRFKFGCLESVLECIDYVTDRHDHKLHMGYRKFGENNSLALILNM